MKFAALLRSSAEHSPELQGLFVCYKQLKKKIKQLPDGQIHDAGRDGVAAEQEEASFVQIIIADVHHFNDLFIEREEDSVIRLGSIEDAAESASTPADIVQVYRRSVNLHGQLLLMVHWSILAYTGLVKILKKHLKRTGLPVHAPHLDNLLSQPFCSVELLGQLVRRAESASQQLAERLRSQGHAAEALTSRSSASSIDELILAARSSVQEMAAESGAGSDHTPQEVVLPCNALPQPAAKRSRTDTSRGYAAAAAAAQPLEEPCAASWHAEAPALSVLLSQAAAAPLLQDAGNSTPASQLAPRTMEASAAAAAAAAAAAPASIPVAAAAATAQPAEAAALAALAAAPAPLATAPAAAVAATGRQLTPAEQTPSSSTILRQTQAALGLWESLHETAVTPSTVLQPHRMAMRRQAVPAASVEGSHL